MTTDLLQNEKLKTTKNKIYTLLQIIILFCVTGIIYFLTNYSLSYDVSSRWLVTPIFYIVFVTVDYYHIRNSDSIEDILSRLKGISNSFKFFMYLQLIFDIILKLDINITYINITKLLQGNLEFLTLWQNIESATIEYYTEAIVILFLLYFAYKKTYALYSQLKQN